MENSSGKINIGIGFTTGRKNFKNILRTYVESWNESGLVEDKNITLNLFVAYDLKYTNTRPSDYKNVDEEIFTMVDSAFYIGNSTIKNEINDLIDQKIVTAEESKLLFGEGYAQKRNAVLYFAVKNRMDYLIFIDDDEYPHAAFKVDTGLVWKGQKVLATHLRYIKEADVTHGHHCGYVSPIPYIKFNEVLTEDAFKLFIETISNDIVSWDSIKMQEGCITYANPEKLQNPHLTEVNEVNGAKFISGSNLCLNLKSAHGIFPFFNPPGARGEDTFLSTCLSAHRVLKVPCYTFHDGFSVYEHILKGVLPNRLKPISSHSDKNTARFLGACIGWIRYKPLWLYITEKDRYHRQIEQMKLNLSLVTPSLCKFFGSPEFKKIPVELENYSNKVTEHFEMFEATKIAWKKVVEYLKSECGCIVR